MLGQGVVVTVSFLPPPVDHSAPIASLGHIVGLPLSFVLVVTTKAAALSVYSYLCCTVGRCRSPVVGQPRMFGDHARGIVVVSHSSRPAASCLYDKISLAFEACGAFFVVLLNHFLYGFLVVKVSRLFYLCL